MRAILSCLLIGYCAVQLVLSAYGGVAAYEHTIETRQGYLSSSVSVD